MRAKDNTRHMAVIWPGRCLERYSAGVLRGAVVRDHIGLALPVGHVCISEDLHCVIKKMALIGTNCHSETRHRIQKHSNITQIYIWNKG